MAHDETDYQAAAREAYDCLRTGQPTQAERILSNAFKHHSSWCPIHPAHGCPCPACYAEGQSHDEASAERPAIARGWYIPCWEGRHEQCPQGHIDGHNDCTCPCHGGYDRGHEQGFAWGRYDARQAPDGASAAVTLLREVQQALEEEFGDELDQPEQDGIDRIYHKVKDFLAHDDSSAANLECPDEWPHEPHTLITGVRCMGRAPDEPSGDCICPGELIGFVSGCPVHDDTLKSFRRRAPNLSGAPDETGAAKNWYQECRQLLHDWQAAYLNRRTEHVGSDLSDRTTEFWLSAPTSREVLDVPAEPDLAEQVAQILHEDWHSKACDCEWAPRSSAHRIIKLVRSADVTGTSTAPSGRSPERPGSGAVAAPPTSSGGAEDVPYPGADTLRRALVLLGSIQGDLKTHLRNEHPACIVCNTHLGEIEEFLAASEGGAE